MNEVTSVPSFDGHNQELRHRKLFFNIHMEQNELFPSPPDTEAQKSKESRDLTAEAQDKYSKLVSEGDGLSLELFDLAEFEGEKDNEPLLHKEYRVQEVPTYKPSVHVYTDEPESLWAISVQVFIPFLIAGLGTVGAGLVLDAVQHWKVFVVVSEVFILVPALLGLKGNLEMTLASRLSTQANLGNLDSLSQQWKITYGNMALLQCQASVVGFLASLFAMIMGWIPEGKFDIHHGLLLCASSLLTASIASLALGLLMVAVVILSVKCHINPDNIATPIAASLGDLTTLALLAWISNFFFSNLGTNVWVAPLVVAFALLLLPLWSFIAHNNEFTHDVLYSGWIPVISAMTISSIGGCILDFAVTRFHGIAVFQPVINGVGGNLVAVQASRISTFLHQRSKLGTLPSSDSHFCIDPCSAFCSSNPHARTARVLMLMVIPGHLIFTYGIHFVQAGHTSITLIFLVTYLTAAVIQVLILLYIAFCMIHWMWKKSIDPDNSAIPYLTALGDFLGTALLSLSFLFLYSVGDKDADVGE
ncbi:solute carrier family 41 member 1-like [Limulus polyphemus]|uniref:Solute carrier family 41 member 1-like n=1 Tax=Limulus polyphemus TaxID=6850 RepID=A0ABM1B0Z4_LIMPO|nr:solute carrier family 41 member 1-like [Limulus polyphemus]XP_013772568.1 solute carrier family 41 member 1-like [Limulus polyphemus]XP_022239396.1 solute carrier family 41 member 1-like [Limulus polyphemus]XP_022239399.1 solute carrier family 41 member 1-like [Limulus polyphemus]